MDLELGRAGAELGLHVELREGSERPRCAQEEKTSLAKSFLKKISNPRQPYAFLVFWELGWSERSSTRLGWSERSSTRLGGGCGLYTWAAMLVGTAAAPIYMGCDVGRHSRRGEL